MFRYWAVDRHVYYLAFVVTYSKGIRVGFYRRKLVELEWTWRNL